MNEYTAALAQPLLGMLLLTLLVWIVMFIKRVGYMNTAGIDAEQLKQPADSTALIAPEANAPANNFKNLFELPVVFYVVCLYLIATGQADALHVNCAWAFLALRAVHSLIHCTYNKVMHRFAIYLLGALALWVMVVRAALSAF
jgi:hypothetical protein